MNTKFLFKAFKYSLIPTLSLFLLLVLGFFSFEAADKNGFSYKWFIVKIRQNTEYKGFLWIK